MDTDECLAALVKERNMPAPPAPWASMSDAERIAHALRVAAKHLDDHPDSLPILKEKLIKALSDTRTPHHPEAV